MNIETKDLVKFFELCQEVPELSDDTCGCSCEYCGCDDNDEIADRYFVYIAGPMYSDEADNLKASSDEFSNFIEDVTGETPYDLLSANVDHEAIDNIMRVLSGKK